jgi:hypothetical protein
VLALSLIVLVAVAVLLLLVALMGASPFFPLVLLLFGGALIMALDAGIRGSGFYRDTAGTWPAGWRAVVAGPRATPYREGERQEWVRVVTPGIPPLISIFLLPLLGLLFFWILANGLALLDLGDVVHGARSLPFVLSSLLLCLARAVAAGASLIGACARMRRLFFLASAAAIGLDLLLASVAIPCSDHRTDDVRMALAGLAVQVPLVLGFAWSLWRRRGLVDTARKEAIERDAASLDPSPVS